MNRAVLTTPEINMSNLVMRTHCSRRRSSLTRSMPESPMKQPKLATLTVPAVIFVPTIESQLQDRWSPEGACLEGGCCQSKPCCDSEEDERVTRRASLYSPCPALTDSSSTWSIPSTGEEMSSSNGDQETLASRRRSIDSKSIQRSIARRSKQKAPPSLPRRQRSSGALEEL